MGAQTRVRTALRGSRTPGTALAALVLAALALAAPASAAPPEPFGHDCTEQDGTRFCPTREDAERVPTFDGIPLDVDVTLPRSGDGPFPTIVMLHGFGGDKTDFESDNPEGNEGEDSPDQFEEDDPDDILFHYNNNFFAKQGYAVVNYSARGFGRSCGQEPREPPDGDNCDKGFIHLADSRFEVRDTQFLLGKLVDQGITDPDGMGVTGISYGGGQSIQLAKLRDQIRGRDGTFAPWRSQKGTPLSISAAFPRWPWSDLVYSLFPNGRFLDFDAPGLRESRNPIGVLLESYVSGLFALGTSAGYICGDDEGAPPPCEDESADLNEDFAAAQRGEPYGREAREALNEIFRFHQGFGLRPGGTPAPLLVENGWTDDLFPVHEAVRIYNEIRARNRGAEVSLQLGDLGHARGSNKKNTDRFFNDQGAAFFDEHLKEGSVARSAVAEDVPAPEPGRVYAFTQTCPEEAPADGPFSARSFLALSPGAFRFSSDPAQLVLSTGGNPALGVAFDPIAGGGDACRQVPESSMDRSGTAIYDKRVRRDFTLLGRPTVRARIDTTQATPGDIGQLDSRLFDVSPDGQQRLITRAAYRLEDNQDGKITFQLNGNGYRFEKGHTVRLQLLGRDSPYLRPSNFPFTVRVSGLTVELPTKERADGEQISEPVLGTAPGGEGRGGGGSDRNSGGGAGDRSGGSGRAGGGEGSGGRPQRDESSNGADEGGDAGNETSTSTPDDTSRQASSPDPDSDLELPFTGLLLGPLAALGAVALTVGALLRRRTRGSRFSAR